jgi:hypothetical protein
MTKLAKLKAIVAASATCAAMFGATSANAYVYGVSHLKIQDLQIAVLNPATNTPVGTATTYTFSQSNTAAINGVGGAFNPAVCGGTAGGANDCGAGPVLDAGVAIAGGSTVGRAQNNFAFVGANQVDTYSHADSVITTAQLVGGVPTNLEQIAESLLNTNGFAQAGVEQTSNTTLLTTFTLATGGSNLSLSFLADLDMRSAINGLEGTYLSQANSNVSFTLTRFAANGTQLGSISWSPQGTAGDNDCTAFMLGAPTCTELADGLDLNYNTSASINPSTDDNSYDVGDNFANFAIFIEGLDAGTYQLALNAVSSTVITRRVPEPDALALLGIALAGLAFTTRRQGRKQA